MRNGYTPSKANPEFWEGGDIPWFRMEDIRTNGRILSDSIQHITQEAVKGGKLFPANSIILSTTATIGEHALLLCDALSNQRFTNFSIKETFREKLAPKFLFYYMFKIGEWCRNNVNSSSFASVEIAKLKKVIIPIPPIRVQTEIVRILDMFSELINELSAELELRKKQYYYYREKLLKFTNDTAQFLPLGEVCELITDFTAAGSFASNATNVKYLQEMDYALLVRTTDLKSLFKNSKVFVYVDEHAFNYLWRVNLNQESIIMPNVGNCGEIYYLTPNMIPHKKAVLGPNSILLRTSPNILNKFLYYILQTNSFQSDLSKITSKAGQPKFNKTNLRGIKIPIPPIAEQERIVAILDKFDSLVNSLSEGLPAEINLRQKQYEYYRNALLSFE